MPPVPFSLGKQCWIDVSDEGTLPAAPHTGRRRWHSRGARLRAFETEGEGSRCGTDKSAQLDQEDVFKRIAQQGCCPVFEQTSASPARHSRHRGRARTARAPCGFPGRILLVPIWTYDSSGVVANAPHPAQNPPNSGEPRACLGLAKPGFQEKWRPLRPDRSTGRLDRRNES